MASKVTPVSGNKSKTVGNEPNDTGEGELHEVTAGLSLPQEGGWGWVVVTCAFFSIFILDGVAYTFGSLLTDIAKDLKVETSLIALVNSTAVAFYFTASPFASALINRHGFRMCAMTGSIICSIALCLAHVTTKFATLFLCYGVIGGIGFSLINMSSSLVVGFYFEKLRSITLAIATCGSSIGVTTLYPANSLLTQVGGWRPTTLLHSGLFGIIFFLAMSFRPLTALSVTKDEITSTRTLFLPSVSSTKSANNNLATTDSKGLSPSPTERLFGAASNVNFPTAATMVSDMAEDTDRPTVTSHPGTSKIHSKSKISATDRPTVTSQPGTSKIKSRSKITLIPNTADGKISENQLKQVQSLLARRVSSPNTDADISIRASSPSVKRSFWQRIFHWQPHSPQFRPMYRDDVFYEGKVQSLPVYQKSMLDTKPEDRTGFEYQMAVTRAADAKEFREDKRTLCPTAIRRVFATMMDPTILKKATFLLMCCSGFFTYLGFLVPYVYLQDRNMQAGVDPKHCRFFISTMGISNAFGRLIIGLIASKLDPINLFAFWVFIAGLSTMLSSLSYQLYYQYIYCCIFGFSISSVACLRSLILVSLYGLDKLTNATGMMLIFLGIGNLMSTPLAGLLKKKFGYDVAFYVAGGFMATSGLILVFVKICAIKDERREKAKNAALAESKEKKSRNPAIKIN
ncbi:major facilitator superfamily domain-containing protein [Phthorimaea operculella]|nr:major facilitator superfamily domain-containing protein [Phthorimaea operculella]